MADQDDELIDQNDIDKLLEAASQTEESSSVDESSELSQDDIDALMNGPVIDASPGDEEGEEDYELDLISQDDINQLVQRKKGRTSDVTQDKTLAEPREDSVGNQEVSAREEPDTPAEPVALEDGFIDESEALSAEECLVSQETIDQLINEDIESSAVEESTAPPEQPLEQFDEEAADSVPGEEITTEQEVVMEDTEQKDTIEKPAPDKVVVDLNDDDDLETDFTDMEDEELQGDIDSFLDDTESEGDDDWEQDSLISQDDIEELIKSSENEDEDALGDLDNFDPENTEEGFDEDTFGDDEPETDGADEDPAVDLEKDKDKRDNNKNEKKKKKKKKKRKIGKKFIIMALSALLFIGLAFMAGRYFLKDEKRETPDQTVTEVARPEEKAEIESVKIDPDPENSKSMVLRPIPENPMKKPLVLRDFLILAPETIQGLSYIAADISIEYATDKIYQDIKNNMPYYRDIIYSAIQRALGSAKGDKITESDLLIIIKKALMEVMPDGAIKKVGFNSFKAG